MTLAPGACATITATFAAPPVDASAFPAYSGFLQVASGAGAVAVRVSYLGLVGSLRDKAVLDTTAAALGYGLPTVWNSAGSPQARGTVYSLAASDQPTVVYRCDCRSPSFRFARRR